MPQLSDAEIQALVDAVVFPGLKDTEVVVSVPLHIPKVLFGANTEAFATSKGWKADVEPSALKFLASQIRTQLKTEFARFYKESLIKAKVQEGQAIADATLNQIFS